MIGKKHSLINPVTKVQSGKESYPAILKWQID